MSWYILSNRNEVEPVHIQDLRLRDYPRTLWLTKQGSLAVSTAFLALDLRPFGRAPMLFETMLFRDGEGRDRELTATYVEAEAAHARMVDKFLKQGL